MPDEARLTIAKELDALHAQAKVAYETRDVAAYRALFSPDLQYTQPNGKTIGLDALMQDVKSQFLRLARIEMNYQRESLEVHGPDSVTEEVSQFGLIEMVVFFAFRRRWELRRRGLYTYCKTSEGWRISKVLVLEESVR